MKYLLFLILFVQGTELLGEEDVNLNVNEVICARAPLKLGNFYIRRDAKGAKSDFVEDEWSIWFGRGDRGEFLFRSGITQFPLVITSGGKVVIIYETFEDQKKCGQFLVCEPEGKAGIVTRSNWYPSFEAAVKDLPRISGFLRQGNEDDLFSDRGDPWASVKWSFPK